MLSIFLFCKMGDASAQVVRDGNINLIPMYGGVKKSRALQKADARLLADFPNRREAATQFAKRGWDYFYAKDPETAIKRFNQAWLLDSTNAEAYWGFGVIEGGRRHNTDALRYLQRSIQLNPTKKRILVDVAEALIGRYELTHQPADLDSALVQLRLFLLSIPDGKLTTEANMRFAVVYYLKRDYFAAWQYVDQVKFLNPAVITDWELIPRLEKDSPH